jgi:hypothetical protein
MEPDQDRVEPLDMEERRPLEVRKVRTPFLKERMDPTYKEVLVHQAEAEDFMVVVAVDLTVALVDLVLAVDHPIQQIHNSLL